MKRRYAIIVLMATLSILSISMVSAEYYLPGSLSKVGGPLWRISSYEAENIKTIDSFEVVYWDGSQEVAETIQIRRSWIKNGAAYILLDATDIPDIPDESKLSTSITVEGLLNGDVPFTISSQGFMWRRRP